MNDDHKIEVSSGRRFKFGANWKRFLEFLSDQKILNAEQSLCQHLKITSLSGKRFLDVGSGSGLFSLAARRLGAEVHSFDYDPESVACGHELRNRYFNNDGHWVIEEASVLDKNFLKKLGEFDVVYSWGVLHHTGAMIDSLNNIGTLVAPGGQLFIAIYNDQGWISCYWKIIKKTYVNNIIARWVIIFFHVPYLVLARYLVRLFSGRLVLERGMNLWHDMIDWLGGYPFEVASPEQIFEIFHAQGFILSELKTCGGRHGCNEYVFVKSSS